MIHKLIRPLRAAVLGSLESAYAAYRGIEVEKPIHFSRIGRARVVRPGRIIVAPMAWVQRDYQMQAEGIIEIGAHAHVGLGARFHAMEGARITLEADCWLNHSVEISARLEVRVGRWSRVGPQVYMIDHDHEMRRDVRIVDQQYSMSPLVIGEDCWVGARAILLKGSGIEDGGVLAAGAVLTKHVPPGEIWAGVPARKIGERR